MILLLAGCAPEPVIISGPIVPDPPAVHHRELPALDALDADLRRLRDGAKAP